MRAGERVLDAGYAHAEPAYLAGLVCAGALPERDSDFFPDPRRIARASGLDDAEVKFIGHLDEADKPALYSAARAFVFPSRYEGFGLPPLEAMACGTPTLVANAGSLPEVVGEAGILLDPDDAQAWANALRQVLTDPKRRELSRVLGLAQTKKFRWDKTARKTRALYEKVVERKG